MTSKCIRLGLRNPAPSRVSVNVNSFFTPLAETSTRAELQLRHPCFLTTGKESGLTDNTTVIFPWRNRSATQGISGKLLVVVTENYWGTTMQHTHHSTVRLAVLGGALTVASEGQAAVIDMGFLLRCQGGLNHTEFSARRFAGGLEFDKMASQNTGTHDGGENTCVSFIINFVSGAFSSYDPATRTWDFDGSGALTVVGGVNLSDGSATNIAAGTSLLTGTFRRAAVIKLDTGLFDFRIATGSFSDAKDASLLAYYGLPTDVPYEGDFNLAFSAMTGEFANSAAPATAAMWLLGNGQRELV